MLAIPAPASRLVLRDYQALAVEATLDALSDARAVCLVAPTGAGKTAMGAAIVQDLVGRGLRVLWVAHRIELVEQAVERMGVPCNVIIAGSRSAGVWPCTVASLQTLARRETPAVDVVIVDECHHIMSRSYRTLLDRLPAAKVIGLTATPTRLDGRPLGDIFDGGAVIAATVSRLIDEGHLVRPRVFTTSVSPDVSGVKKTAGDYNEAQLELACNTSVLRGDIVRHWQERCPGRPTVLFAVSLAHSAAIVGDFAAAGIVAVTVDGTMGKLQRESALSAIRTGQAHVLCNVGIVTEGWDFPGLEACILARPTSSLSLLLQMVGRVMRPCSGKNGALVLDHAGNHVRHGVLPWTDIDWAAKMEGRKVAHPAPLRTCKACYAVMAASCRECPVCGEVFAKPKEAEAAEITTDKTAQLEEVTCAEVLLMESYLAKRKAEPNAYVAKLIERVRRGKARPEFLAYVRAARGSVGEAAYNFKKQTGRWP